LLKRSLKSFAFLIFVDRYAWLIKLIFLRPIAKPILNKDPSKRPLHEYRFRFDSPWSNLRK
jgi:hypothetical protein